MGESWSHESTRRDAREFTTLENLKKETKREAIKKLINISNANGDNELHAAASVPRKKSSGK